MSSHGLMLPKRPPCGAKLANKPGFCRRHALEGKTRCGLHGGCSTGPTSEEGKRSAIERMQAGRLAWLERKRLEREAAANGEVIPPTQKRAATMATRPKQSDPIVAKAERALAVVRQDFAESRAGSEVSATSDLPLTHIEHLDRITGKALSVIEEHLGLDAKGDVKIMTLKQNAALSTLGASIKLQAVRVQHNNAESLEKLLDCLRSGKPATFLDPPPSSG